MNSRRVTQLDIATRAGVHPSTVSLALKSHPGIPDETRKRILKLAKEMGYVPDPMLSALSLYRTSRRDQPYRGTLAWLVNHNHSIYKWQTVPIFREYFAGAKEEAEAHGYNLDVFDLNKAGAEKKPMGSVLESRGVKGILLCPQGVAHAEIDFPWKKFSAVTFGYTLAKPQLHIVSSAQYRCVVETIQRLRAAGYSRIGYMAWKDFDKRADNNVIAAYVGEQYETRSKVLIPPLIGEYKDRDVFFPWWKKYRPDAIISVDASIFNTLQKFNIAVPEEVGFACFGLSEGSPRGIAGVDQNSRHCGRVAVKFLAGMIQHGERGVPEVQQQLLVSGTWVPGSSIQSRK